MSQAVLICDDEVLSDMYTVNLSVYVDMNVTTKSNPDEALQLIELVPNINMIFCVAELNQVPIAQKVKETLAKKKLKTPLILIGKRPNGLEVDFHIPLKYDLKFLIKTAADILEITAQDMVSKVMPDYFPIPLKMFRNLSQALCDIYFRHQHEDGKIEYHKIFTEGQEISSQKIENYKNKEVDKLYVVSEERLKFINQTSQVIIKKLEETDIPAEERVELMGEAVEMVASQLAESPEATEEMTNISKSCVKSLRSLVKEVPKLKGILDLLLSSQNSYIYSHSVVATYISSGIIEHISWGAEEQADKLAFAFFYHDLFLVPVAHKFPNVSNEESFLFNDSVTDKEKELVLNHAKMAGELVRSMRQTPLGADTIIQQHHGTPSGIGFAVEFKDNISPLAKVMMIAEELASEVLECHQKKSKINKVESFERLYQKFSRPSYQKIIDAAKEVPL